MADEIELYEVVCRGPRIELPFSFVEPQPRVHTWPVVRWRPVYKSGIIGRWRKGAPK